MPINRAGKIPSLNTLIRSSAIAMRAAAPSLTRDAFEVKVRRSRNGALLVACLHLLSRFFSLCALTWATVVLLGGFAPILSTFDFLFVTTLLILEGARLFILHVSGKFLFKTLFRESHRPEEFEFKDMQYIKGNCVDLVSQTVSSIFALASLISIAVCFIRTGMSLTISANDSRKNSNLVYVLYIFYMLVMVNSILAIESALLRLLLRSKCDGRPSDIILSKQNCLMSYHDEVYKMALHVGILEAAQLDVLEFAYSKLCSDYKRNIRPPLIKAQNKDLISYLYHNQQGVAMCCECLKSPDVWKKLVAANLPGFWVEEQRIELQVALFWGLRERMYGAGKDAESALNSIECLAQSWADMPKSKPYPFLINDPTTATNIVDTLVHLLLEPIRPTLLFQLRAFEACCRNHQVLQHMYGGRSPQEAQELCQKLQASIAAGRQDEITAVPLQELCRKLFEYVSQKGIWMTTKIYAGNALLSLLCYGTRELGEEAMKSLQRPVEEYIAPAKARGDGAKLPYFWLNDMILVEKLRKNLRMPRYGHWEGVRMRNPDGTELSPQKS